MLISLYRELELEEDLNAVNQLIREQVESSTSFIRESLSGLIESPGKLLRPALMLLSSRFGEPDRKKIQRLAAAVEMLHLATLIHDDIIDQASSRRGIPTLHTRFGERNAVLLGDFLFTRSFQIAADHTDIEMGRYIAGVVNSICESEIRQHGQVSPAATSFKEYHRRIMGKTAALFALSAYVGAHESGVEEREAARLKKIGYNLGSGFQIIDDILDFSPKKDKIGKVSGTDIRQGIVNLPLLFALQNDTGALEKKLRSRPSNGRALKSVIKLTVELNGIDRARRCAHAYTRKALYSVKLLPRGEALTHLKSYTMYLLDRRF